MIEDIWAIEYSVRQNCFHIAKLTDTLKINIRTSINLIDNDYRIVGIANSYEEARDKAANIREMINTKNDSSYTYNFMNHYYEDGLK